MEASILGDAGQTHTPGARAVPAILWGGLIAGAMDITYASVDGILNGRPVMRTLQSVASGLLGRPAFQGGWDTALLGLAAHFTIALGAAATYYLVSRKFPYLIHRAALSGMLFGALVYLIMNRVVVPLSAAPFRIRENITGLLVHMLLVGLPIALSVRRHSLR